MDVISVSLSVLMDQPENLWRVKYFILYADEPYLGARRYR